MNNFFRPTITNALDCNIASLVSLRSFDYHGAGIFPSPARTRRPYLTDDVLDLVIVVRGDGWHAFVRAAVSLPDRALYRPETFLQIDGWIADVPGEDELDAERRGVEWSNSL